MIRKHRMFYNDDGDSILMGYCGPFRREMVTDSVASVVGTPITTFIFCVSSTDPVPYPSKVASQYGWRQTECERTSPVYRRWYQFYQHVRNEGWDIPQMVSDRAEQMGLEFIPSMRMNDLHFCQKLPPEEHPLTGEWYLKHKGLIIDPGHKWARYEWSFLAPDFTHREVRDFRLAQAREIIDRYAVDGFETDWTRHYVYFPEDKAQPDLITDMMREVRRCLDQRGAQLGRRLLFVARVANNIDECLKIGHDVRTWVRERLVDYLVPSSPSRYISLDMPIREWAELVDGTPIEVHPSTESACWCGNGQAPLEMYRAAAINQYNMGAHGFYVFNLFCRGYPLADDAYVIMRDVSDPAALERRDKVFAAGPYTWCKGADTLPVELKGAGATARVAVTVGDDLAQARQNTTLNSVTLGVRLGGHAPEDRVEILLNDEPLDMSRARVWAAENRQPGDGPQPPGAQWESTQARGPFARLRFDLTADELPKLGDNLITIRRLNDNAEDRKYALQVVDVFVDVKYDYCGKSFTTR